MKNNKQLQSGNTKYRLSAAILGLIVTTALVAGSSYAFGGKAGFGAFRGEGGVIKEAIENNNYSALGEDPKMTEEQFNIKVKMYNLMAEGEYDEAKALMQENGFKGAGCPFNKSGLGTKMGCDKTACNKTGKKEMDPEKYEAVNAAIAAEDYEAWLAAAGENCPMAEKITEANFPRLVEAHNHMNAARVIFEELGIERGMGWHK